MPGAAPRALLVALALGGAACGTTPAPAPAALEPPPAATAPAPQSLYLRLGGLPAIGAVVDELLKNIAGDARIAHRFALSDLGHLRKQLVDQLCATTGGPCAYQGADMKAAHQGQRISSADFTALVEDLDRALDQCRVPAQEKGELLGALAALQGAIVEVP